MPGYYESYLGGLEKVLPEITQQRRLQQEMEQRHFQNLMLQQQMKNQEARTTEMQRRNDYLYGGAPQQQPQGQLGEPPASPDQMQMPPEIASAPRAIQDRWKQQNAQGVGVDVVPPALKDVHGDEYIAKLPVGLQSVVKSIKDYQLPIDKIASLRNNQRMALTQHVMQADPNFDFKEYPARQKVVNDFMSGPTSKNITSLNMSIYHLGTFLDLAAALKNGDVRAFNGIKNQLANQMGDPALNNVQMSSQAVGQELMRVFRQVNASESEAKAFEARLGTSGSPAQIEGAAATAVSLLKGRLDSINNQWKRGMKTEKDFPGLLDPAAQKMVERMGRAAPQAPAAASRKPISQMTNAELMQYRKELAGQK